MDFTIIGEIADIETFAVGQRIRERGRLQERYGKGRWRKRKGRVTVRLADGTVREAEVHWYETSGIGRKELKIKRQLMLCLRNDGYEVSLERRKVYTGVPDADAARHGQVRVIDESGEDYLFPARYFASIELPKAVRRAVLAAV